MDEDMDLVKKGNLKLSVFTCFPYSELKKICDFIVSMGYECYLADNGNMVFQKVTEEREVDEWGRYEGIRGWKKQEVD